MVAEHQVILCERTSITNTYATSYRKERSGKAVERSTLLGQITQHSILIPE